MTRARECRPQSDVMERSPRGNQVPVIVHGRSALSDGKPVTRSPPGFFAVVVDTTLPDMAIVGLEFAVRRAPDCSQVAYFCVRLQPSNVEAIRTLGTPSYIHPV
jgi:hypothetical protein